MDMDAVVLQLSKDVSTLLERQDNFKTHVDEQFTLLKADVSLLKMNGTERKERTSFLKYWDMLPDHWKVSGIISTAFGIYKAIEHAFHF